MQKQPAVYILASQKNGTLYVGVTSDLLKRVWQHKQHLVEGFTKKYSVDRLVYFEQHDSMVSAIEREKKIKAGSRARKIKLIESKNSGWKDLYPDIL